MKTENRHTLSLLIISTVLLALIVSSCGGSATPTPAPTQDVAAIQTEAAQAVIADLTANAPAPTEPPPATPEPTEVPPPPVTTPDPNVPVAVVPTPAPGEPAAVATSHTTIYGGPGENYVVYGTFLNGSTATVVGISEDGLWWVVSVPPAPSHIGWVVGTSVNVTGAEGVPVVATPPVPPTVEMVPPGPEDPQATAIANVNVRAGPGTNFPAFGVAPFGTTGRVIGKSEDSEWWVVRLDPARVGAGFGWVSAQYTLASNVEDIQVIATPPAPQVATPPPPPSGAPTATTIEFVNVRSGPGTNFPVLVVAPPGSTGEVTGRSSDGFWWQVRIPTQFAANGLGWVSADWVTTQNTSSVPVVASPTPPPSVPSTPPPPSGSASCAIVSQTPADATVFSPGASFTTTWVLQNTGSARWALGEYDVAFVGAYNNIRMHQGSDLYDISSAVEPGWTYNFSVPMIAPFEPGVYGEAWQVILGSQTICPFYVYITVR